MCDSARSSQPPKLLLEPLHFLMHLNIQSPEPAAPPLPCCDSAGLGQQRWTLDFTPNSEKRRSYHFSTVLKTLTTIWRHATKSGFDLGNISYHRTATPGQQTELAGKNYTEKYVSVLRACSSAVRHTWKTGNNPQNQVLEQWDSGLHPAEFIHMNNPKAFCPTVCVNKANKS